jgi:hypothetical protein
MAGASARDRSRAEVDMSLRRFVHRARWDEEHAEELESYLAVEIDENIARGLAPSEARRGRPQTRQPPARARGDLQHEHDRLDRRDLARR